MDFKNLLAQRTGKMGASAIREILKVVSQPGMLSLAGGIPAPENVVYVSTFSKIFAPGLRVGFFVAPELIGKWLVLAKQGIDLHTSTFTQALAAEYLSGGYLEEHLPKILNMYRPKQEAMFHALEAYFPGSFRWSRPEGGMFLWAEGPDGIDMEKIYWKSIEKKVAFVPGKFFFTRKGEGIETMRLNYTMTDEETISAKLENFIRPSNRDDWLDEMLPEANTNLSVTF